MGQFGRRAGGQSVATYLSADGDIGNLSFLAVDELRPLAIEELRVLALVSRAACRRDCTGFGTYVKLLGRLAECGVVLLDKEPGDFVLAKVALGTTRLLGGGRGAWCVLEPLQHCTEES